MVGHGVVGGNVNVSERDGHVLVDGVGCGIDLILAHVVAELPIVDGIGFFRSGGQIGKAFAFEHNLAAQPVAFGILIGRRYELTVACIDLLIRSDDRHLCAGLIDPVKGAVAFHFGKRDDGGVNALGQVGGQQSAAVFVVVFHLIQVLKVDDRVKGKVEDAGGQEGERDVAHVRIQGEEVVDNVNDAAGEIAHAEFFLIQQSAESAVSAIGLRERFAGEFFKESLWDALQDARFFAAGGGFVMRVKEVFQDRAEILIRARELCFRVGQAALVDILGGPVGIELGDQIAVQAVGGVLQDRADRGVILVVGKNFLGGDTFKEFAETGNCFCFIDQFLCVFVFINEFCDLFQSVHQIGSRFFGELFDEFCNGRAVGTAEFFEQEIQRFNVFHPDVQAGILVDLIEQDFHLAGCNELFVEIVDVHIAQAGDQLGKRNIAERAGKFQTGHSLKRQQFLPQADEGFAIAGHQRQAVEVGHRLRNVEGELEEVVGLFQFDVAIQHFGNAADRINVSVDLDSQVDISGLLLAGQFVALVVGSAVGHVVHHKVDRGQRSFEAGGADLFKLGQDIPNGGNDGVKVKFQQSVFLLGDRVTIQKNAFDARGGAGQSQRQKSVVLLVGHRFEDLVHIVAEFLKQDLALHLAEQVRHILRRQEREDGVEINVVGQRVAAASDGVHDGAHADDLALRQNGLEGAARFEQLGQIGKTAAQDLFGELGGVEIFHCQRDQIVVAVNLGREELIESAVRVDHLHDLGEGEARHVGAELGAQEGADRRVFEQVCRVERDDVFQRDAGIVQDRENRVPELGDVIVGGIADKGVQDLGRNGKSAGGKEALRHGGLAGGGDRAVQRGIEFCGIVVRAVGDDRFDLLDGGNDAVGLIKRDLAGGGDGRLRGFKLVVGAVLGEDLHHLRGRGIKTAELDQANLAFVGDGGFQLCGIVVAVGAVKVFVEDLQDLRHRRGEELFDQAILTGFGNGVFQRAEGVIALGSVGVLAEELQDLRRRWRKELFDQARLTGIGNGRSQGCGIIVAFGAVSVLADDLNDLLFRRRKAAQRVEALLTGKSERRFYRFQIVVGVVFLENADDLGNGGIKSGNFQKARNARLGDRRFHGFEIIICTAFLKDGYDLRNGGIEAGNFQKAFDTFLRDRRLDDVRVVIFRAFQEDGDRVRRRRIDAADLKQPQKSGGGDRRLQRFQIVVARIARKNGKDLLRGGIKSGRLQNRQNTGFGEESGFGVLRRVLDRVDIQIALVAEDEFQILARDRVGGEQAGKILHTFVGDDRVIQILDPIDERGPEGGILLQNVLYFFNVHAVRIARNGECRIVQDILHNDIEQFAIQLDQVADDAVDVLGAAARNINQVGERQRFAVVVFQRSRVQTGDQRVHEPVKVGEHRALFFQRERGEFDSEGIGIQIVQQRAVVDGEREFQNFVRVDGGLNADNTRDDGDNVLQLVGNGGFHQSLFVHHIQNDADAAQVFDERFHSNAVLADQNVEDRVKRSDRHNVGNGDQFTFHHQHFVQLRKQFRRIACGIEQLGEFIQRNDERYASVCSNSFLIFWHFNEVRIGMRDDLTLGKHHKGECRKDHCHGKDDNQDLLKQLHRCNLVSFFVFRKTPRRFPLLTE